MNDNLLIEEREIGNHRIRIYYDTWAKCPCTNWDMAARYLFEFSDSKSLHGNCNWKDWFSENWRHTIEDALRRMAADVIAQKDIIAYYKAGKVAGYRLIYNRSEHLWELQYKCGWGTRKGEWEVDKSFEPYELKNGDYRSELVESLENDDLVQLISDCAKDFVIKEWSSTGYSQGDYCYGIAYMSKERFEKMVDKDTANWKERAEKLIDMEVKEIGMWMWGDCKGYILEKKVQFTKVYDDDDHEDEEGVEWEEVGSCWGFFMETEDLIKEVISEYDLKEAA